VTTHKEKADYVIVLDHEADKDFLLHRNKIAVFNRDGDAIFTDSTLALGTSVANACESIRKDKSAQ
jgi:uracil phosphoribosyltransferase